VQDSLDVLRNEIKKLSKETENDFSRFRSEATAGEETINADTLFNDPFSGLQTRKPNPYVLAESSSTGRFRQERPSACTL
jgi:hypothetical protein